MKVKPELLPKIKFSQNVEWSSKSGMGILARYKKLYVETVLNTVSTREYFLDFQRKGFMKVSKLIYYLMLR